MKNEYNDYSSICGVYCKACPSFHAKTCLSCRSKNKKQKRTSKWSCKIRNCCFEKEFHNCAECDEFPCKIRRRLDKTYISRYKINLVGRLRRLNEIGIQKWTQEQIQLYKCKYCGGIISPYSFICFQCDKKNDDKQ
ncbi:MAG: DUF3795 domain-containing protein [archaeon]|nr:DUF3795 domain-containing protein [archaeon]